MDRFVVVEVGSTTSKGYLYDNGNFDFQGLVSIEFKKNYKLNNTILESDKEKLYNYIFKLKELSDNIFVYGTSIFRNLTNGERDNWILEFKEKTGFDFKVVSAEEESNYTVYGALQYCDVKDPVAVMVGGGGSTELAIYQTGKMIEKREYNFGAQDITDQFPDLAEDKVVTDFEVLINYAHSLIDGLDHKAKYMILAGGDYLTFYQKLNFPMVNNSLYKDNRQPFMIDSKTMEEFDKKYFYDWSLDEVIRNNGEANWWKNTRGMRVCVTMLVRLLECEYIIPTKIGMLYGIVAEILKH